MRKIDKTLKNLIENNALALSTVDNKNPHTIAVGYVKVVGKKLIISNNYIVKTIENIKKNNNVSLAVWNKDWKKKCIGFQLNGKARYFVSGKWKEFIKKIPINKGEPCKGAIVVSVNKIKKLA